MAENMTLAAHAKWLRQAAEEICKEGHAGWGNTCELAADAIDAHLTRPAQAVDVDSLAQEIRRVDGTHSLGAGALAEALMPFITRAIGDKP